jgi:hypothetical protein
VILNFAKGTHAGTESDSHCPMFEVDREIAEARALS